MSYTDLRDFDCEYSYTDPVTKWQVDIEKLGGGTVGKTYTGERWRYIVRDDKGAEKARGQDYTAGMPSTHQTVAADVLTIVLDKFGMEGEHEDSEDIDPGNYNMEHDTWEVDD